MAGMEPSTDWSTLSFDGDIVAEVWSMPDGNASTLVFLVPRARLEPSEDRTPIHIELLLQAAGVSTADVESWRLGDDSLAGDADSDLTIPLPLPTEDDDQLTIHVRLKPRASSEVEDIPLEKWQALDSLWKAILGLESFIDTARMGMESLRNEMDAAFRRPLAVEEKLNALQADVAQWTKAKSRVHHALPKVREFIHKATWSLAVPERQRLEEIVKNHIEPRVPMAGVDRIRERLEHLQKDRQVLLATGNAVHQECRGILGEIQRATSSLQRNAAERAKQKRSAGREKGKHF
jgi:hypothetical protein